MATTGTTNFNPDFTEIAEEAWERAGAEMRTGYDLRTARRSLNLLTIEWQNRGINMWTIDEGEISLVNGTATYNLPADTVDLLEHVIRENDGIVNSQTDLNITRLSMPDYSSIPNKLTPGRPINVLVTRAQDIPTITLWPIPNNSGYKFVYWRMRRIEDVGKGIETQDIPFRFMPALVAGLAYYIAQKIPEIAGQRIPILKQEYEEQFQLAAFEDREKATMRIVPRISRI